MTNAMTVRQDADVAVMNSEQVAVFRNLTGKDLTDPEFKFALSFSQASGLNPLLHQVYFIKRGGKLGVQIGIDGYRIIAQRSGEYEGETAPEWCGRDGEWREVWLEQEPPAAARVGVYRHGFREAVYGVAALTEFRDGNNQLWKSMPANLLAKCAEAQALRKAFGNEIADAVRDSPFEVEYSDLPRQAPPQREPFAMPQSTREAPQEAPKAPPKDVAPKANAKPDFNAFWMVVTDELGMTPQDVREHGDVAKFERQEQLDDLLVKLRSQPRLPSE